MNLFLVPSNKNKSTCTLELVFELDITLKQVHFKMIFLEVNGYLCTCIHRTLQRYM